MSKTDKDRIPPMPDGVRVFRTFEDGSGVDCLIDIRDFASGQTFTYAAHLVGVPRLHLVAPLSGSRAASKRAAAEARRRFQKAIDTQTSPEWRALNAAMYADIIAAEVAS